MTERDELSHVGTPRHSGRYPWGSGENPEQRNTSFLTRVAELEKKGLTPTEVAKGMGMTVTQLRANKAIEKNKQLKADQAQAQKLKAKGMSNVAIGEQMGRNESSIRALLNPVQQEKADILHTVSNKVKDAVDKHGVVDIGAGVENHLGVSKEKLNTAVAMLEEQGYKVHKYGADQLGTGKTTNMKVLAKPEIAWKDINNGTVTVGSIHGYSEDGGRTFLGIEKPKNLNSKRVDIRYAEDGGAQKDGVIELRRGVDELSLGKARYAQVRIAVDGTHYLKGMAMYADDLPDGVDVRFNTNKTRADAPTKHDAMKKLKIDKATGEVDADNPFGSIVRQKHYLDSSGKKQLSALNIVGSFDPDGNKTPGEEGGWATWSKTLSSQMLSKQSPALAKEQLGKAYKSKQQEYDEIMALTNPTVKKHLLEKFADGADSSAKHLKAAGLPGTAAHVILPINSLKDHEVFAPNYNNGDKVVLIRHPHGGIFEIPELTVNNRNKEANSLIKQAKDAVGINAKVAERLSGADFDGDTVLVIPNNHGKVKTAPALEGLKNFDPKAEYKKYPGMKVISAKAKQQQMGDVSNLITDMTIKKAPFSEIARAVRHSMVVIDAEKHELNYKQSAIDNGIAELKKKYQTKENGRTGGASTIVSQAKSDARIPKRKPRPAKDGGPIDPATGEKMWVPTGETYRKYDKATKQFVGPEISRTEKVAKMDLVKNAHDLSSGTPMEIVYADHANRLKALANNARKAQYATKTIPYSPSAKAAYRTEVDSLAGKLNTAQKNAPLERKAQLAAKAIVSAKVQANPDMEKDEIKKLSGLALTATRARYGARKIQVDITPAEWNAIQAGAISNNMLENILKNADIEKVKQLAMPRETKGLAPTQLARAKTMLSKGATQAEVAQALGVSTTTLNTSLG